MPVTIKAVSGSLLLAAAIVLAITLSTGGYWTPQAIVAIRFALAASLIVVVLWVIVDIAHNLGDRWRRFTSRPY